MTSNSTNQQKLHMIPFTIHPQLYHCNKSNGIKKTGKNQNLQSELPAPALRDLGETLQLKQYAQHPLQMHQPFFNPEISYLTKLNPKRKNREHETLKGTKKKGIYTQRSVESMKFTAIIHMEIEEKIRKLRAITL